MNNNWIRAPCCVCRSRGTACEFGCPFYFYFRPCDQHVYIFVDDFFGIDTFITIFNMARDRDDAARTLIRDARSRFERPLAAGCPEIISRLIQEIILDRQLIHYFAAAPPSWTSNNIAGVPAVVNPQHYSCYHPHPVQRVQRQAPNPAPFRGTFGAQNSSTSPSNLAVQAYGNYHVQANYARQNVQASQDNTRLGTSLNLPGQQRQRNLRVQANNTQNVGRRLNLPATAHSPSPSALASASASASALASVASRSPPPAPLSDRNQVNLNNPTTTPSASASASASAWASASASRSPPPPLLDRDASGSRPKQD